MINSVWPVVLGGASGYPDPAFAAVMMFLLAGLLGLQLFRGMPVQALPARLGLVVLILGAAAVGTVLVSGSSVTMFGRAAGVLAGALATASAVGGFLTVHRSSKPHADETPSTLPQ